MKRKVRLVIAVAVIVLVTVVLVLLLPGGGKKNGTEETPGPMDTPSESVTTEGKSAGEKQEDNQSEGNTEHPVVQLPTEGGNPGTVTEKATETATEKIIDGSGSHKGKLGSSFEIPEGFRDISPKGHENGYFYVFENPDYGMRLQVEESHLTDRDVSFETEYSVLHNLYKTDTGTQVTYDKKEDTHYCISGYTNGGKTVFYVEGFKHPDRNEVQIYSEYPNDANKAVCDGFLEVLQDTLEYHFVEDPDRTEEPDGTGGADPSDPTGTTDPAGQTGVAGR